jgi:hypothetical protein
MADDRDRARAYEPPALRSLGTVAEVTSVSDEKTVSALEQ